MHFKKPCPLNRISKRGFSSLDYTHPHFKHLFPGLEGKKSTKDNYCQHKKLPIAKTVWQTNAKK